MQDTVSKVKRGVLATVKAIWEPVTVFIAILTVLWAVGRPAAEEFIKNIHQKKIEQLEAVTGSVKQEQAVQSERLGNIDKNQMEIKGDLKVLSGDIKQILILMQARRQ